MRGAGGRFRTFGLGACRVMSSISTAKPCRLCTAMDSTLAMATDGLVGSRAEDSSIEPALTDIWRVPLVVGRFCVLLPGYADPLLSPRWLTCPCSAALSLVQHAPM